MRLRICRFLLAFWVGGRTVMMLFGPPLVTYSKSLFLITHCHHYFVEECSWKWCWNIEAENLQVPVHVSQKKKKTNDYGTFFGLCWSLPRKAFFWSHNVIMSLSGRQERTKGRKEEREKARKETKGETKRRTTCKKKEKRNWMFYTQTIPKNLSPCLLDCPLALGARASLMWQKKTLKAESGQHFGRDVARTLFLRRATRARG